MKNIHIENIKDLFVCSLIKEKNSDSMDLEHILIRASTVEDALSKLETELDVSYIEVVDKKNDTIFAHVELKGDQTCHCHILIDRPIKLIE